jgi:hypothetical protein
MESVNIDKIYQRIGEFVVSFQWLENRVREIGWLILDPHRHEWPPKALRDESNYQLINRVESLYVDLVDGLEIEDSKERKEDFGSIAAACHAMRRYRNNLLHSAFVELKASGGVLGILRSNPELKIDQETGELLFDQEVLSEDAILGEMKRLAELAIALNAHYMQLIHWAPFDKLKR